MICSQPMTIGLLLFTILHLMHDITTSEHCYTPKLWQKHPPKYTNSPECSCCGGGALPDPVTTPPARNVRASTTAEAATSAVSNIRGNILCRRCLAGDWRRKWGFWRCSVTSATDDVLPSTSTGRPPERQQWVVAIISGSRNQQRSSRGTWDLLKN